jgi:cyclic pyranopterin monophosphate synthase
VVENKLTHMDEAGRARMVDVGDKEETARVGVAEAVVRMRPETLELIKAGRIKKGDVLAVAQVAGVMGAKKTPDLIPMCHPLQITAVDFDFRIDERESTITVQAAVKTFGRTGVEMEALTGVAAAALTIYDMCKAVDKGMVIEDISLVAKSGGRSGRYERPAKD